ncbi:hypothetical protein SAMN06297280_3457 [Arsukibacterium tuosuense]|uniref:Tetratricopeptide repeat protein n=1 Tax=Arsukibacterium tuosuense TaxID=1323745 RepID=A0A285JH03_9GAMM|nr:hypothetical protein [Arsukibacterium tuosuense]SNY58656.1 hypothetical protein SAMN06297280_3457 [Arsukibacterium tuosuense]
MVKSFLSYLLIVLLSATNFGFASEQEAAEHALLQGDATKTKALLDSIEQPASPKHLELEVIYHLMLGNTESAINQLNEYEKRFGDRADTHAFAAEAWRRVGHQANIFSKRKYYNKALASKWRAGELAPGNPKWLVLQASAAAQLDKRNKISSDEFTLTKQVMSLDEKWGFIAQINLAQNTDDIKQGLILTQQAHERFPDDFFVQERIAQFYWRLGERAQSQQHFFQACKNYPQTSWFDKLKWLNSCLQVAVFADKYGLGREVGVQALSELLRSFKLPTKDNLDLAIMLTQLAQGDEAQPAWDFLNTVIRTSNDQNLVKAAQKALSNRS